MFFKETLQLLIHLFILTQIAGYSYNRPVLCCNSTWNPNGTTVLNETLIGSNLFDLFIDQNNSIYIPNQNNGQIPMFPQGNFSSMEHISLNLINASNLFVTGEGDIYIDTFYSSVSVISEMKANSTSLSSIPRMNFCQQCFDFFISDNQILYCSLSEYHQIISKSLINQWNHLVIAAGTGSAGSTSNTLQNPRGIFLDETNQDLYVADCGNDRVKFFKSQTLTGTTKVGNGSSYITFDLSCPTGIALDSQSYLFIVDSHNNRIIGQNSNGFRCVVGCYQSVGSSLNHPLSLSFDSTGNIFVVDQRNNRIQQFDLLSNSAPPLTLAGVQLNLNPTLLPSGWSLCYSATYATAMGTSSLPTILSSCNRTNLLLGCRPIGTVNLTIAAMGHRNDVLYNCGSSSSCTHIANGVGWYYSDSYSWGFVSGGDNVTRNHCDSASTNAIYRLCWHTKNDGGYRYGSTTLLNNNTSWEKVIYHAN
ncbi:unnamed protein product [Adineta ricciae]|uniref:NHL repeat containing protein n=1 Tax=Adineta ricciae TaxID=249248 RepID=A0A814VMN4_ADIRI|nr:unnamed protein product [Adineta ricciae]